MANTSNTWYADTEPSLARGEYNKYKYTNRNGETIVLNDWERQGELGINYRGRGQRASVVLYVKTGKVYVDGDQQALTRLATLLESKVVKNATFGTRTPHRDADFRAMSHTIAESITQNKS